MFKINVYYCPNLIFKRIFWDQRKEEHNLKKQNKTKRKKQIVLKFACR